MQQTACSDAQSRQTTTCTGIKCHRAMPVCHTPTGTNTSHKQHAGSNSTPSPPQTTLLKACKAASGPHLCAPKVLGSPALSTAPYGDMCSTVSHHVQVSSKHHVQASSHQQEATADGSYLTGQPVMMEHQVPDSTFVDATPLPGPITPTASALQSSRTSHVRGHSPQEKIILMDGHSIGYDKPPAQAS